MKPWQTVIFGILFVIIGIASIIYGVYAFNNRNEKAKNYIDIEASVIDHDSQHDSEGSVTYAPIVEYTVDGKKYKAKSTTYSSSVKPIGSKIYLKYNPTNPNEVIFVGDFGVIIFIIVGGVFIVVGIVIAILALKSMRNSNQTNINTKEESAMLQPNGLYNNPEIINKIDTTNVSQNTNNNNQNDINL